MTSPLDPHTKQYSHIGGSNSEVIDRLNVSELCKGWPMYRDNSEWANFRSMFTNDAHVWTSKTLPSTASELIRLLPLRRVVDLALQPGQPHAKSTNSSKYPNRGKQTARS